MAKEFKTIDEQIALLNSRGIKTDDQTKFQLMRGRGYSFETLRAHALSQAEPRPHHRE